MLDQFEDTLKRDFVDTEAEDEFSCPVGGIPDDPISGVLDGSLVLTREDMRNIFDPIINQIIPLVQDQIDNVEGQNQPELGVSVWHPFLLLGLN